MSKRNMQHATRNTDNVYAVVLVGGIGKRLQPLSKPSSPKPFLSVTKDRKTIFAKTIARIRKVIPIENIIVVANKRQACLIKKSSPKILKENLLLEKASKKVISVVPVKFRISIAVTFRLLHP